MKKVCANCKFCGNETEHLQTDWLKEQAKKSEYYTCSNASIANYFRGSWVFGNIKQEAMCGGSEFPPKILQTELFT